MKKGVDILWGGVRYWRKSPQRQKIGSSFQQFLSLCALPLGALEPFPVFAERMQASFCTGTANPGRGLNKKKGVLL